MVDQKLLDILVCPWCLGELDLADNKLTCQNCRTVYAIEDDIPNMLVHEAQLFCPKCNKEMEKAEEHAFCSPCGLRFSTVDRIEGSLLEHATPYSAGQKEDASKDK